jgi:hypothetical protein
MEPTGKEKALALLQQLRCDSSGAVHPLIGEDRCTSFIVLSPDYPEQTITAFTEYLKALYPEQEDYYRRIADYVFKAEEELRKRERMHRIYKTEIGVPKKDFKGEVIGEQRFSLFDMSALKVQEQAGMYPDDSYYREPPLYVKDIARFTQPVATLNFQSVYLLNPTERAVLDLKDYTVYLLRDR